jgi:Tol biopolymer transport system component
MKHFIPASITGMLLYLLFTVLLFSCGNGNTIPYPQPLPDSTALVFLPDLISKDSLDFNAIFSPDGQSFFFSRSMNKQSNMYVSKYNGTNWAEPMLLPVSVTHYSDADPAFAPDGKLYFISNRPANASDTTKDYDIWFSSPLAGGGWSAPENLASVNSDSNEFYVSFSGKGHLYFASSRKGGFGEEDIYVSKWINGQYTTPANLGEAINSPKSEYDPFISTKEDLLVFTASNWDDSFGGADLYCSKPGKNNTWRQAVNLGHRINTTSRDFCPSFSPDSKYFFFSSERNVKWISARYVLEQIDRLLQRP